MLSGSQRAAGDTSLAVRIENPLDQPDWNTRLSTLPAASFFHRAEWAKVLHETYRYMPLHLVRYEGARFQALMPLMEVNSCWTGKRGISLPFTDACEPLASNRNGLESLFAEAASLGRQRDWRYLELRGGALHQIVEGAAPSLRFYSHELDLGQPLNVLFNGLESSVRRALRKAEKSGLTVETSQNISAVREFYALHCETRREHGLPPQPFAFFLNIHQHVLSQNLGMIFSVKQENRTIAAAVFFVAGEKAIYKFGASASRFQHLRPNNLLMWEAIRQCAARGAKVLDFGRTSLGQEGLRRFKLGWGSREQLLRYYKFDFRQDRFVTDRDQTEGWHTRIFRLLPLSLSRAAGALLYRHVA